PLPNVSRTPDFLPRMDEKRSDARTPRIKSREKQLDSLARAPGCVPAAVFCNNVTIRFPNTSFPARSCRPSLNLAALADCPRYDAALTQRHSKSIRRRSYIDDLDPRRSGSLLDSVLHL